ncbi:MAG: hypothetical protein LBP54_08065 [Campylobacteraceae bacterium]|nr:hypothetical protein [Campylobacteraceae bacterium]
MIITKKGVFLKSLHIFLFIFISALFCGCASKNSDENITIKQSIINTQKARLTLHDNSTLLISATYLNNIKKYSENEFNMIALAFYYSKKGSINIGEPNITVNLKAAHAKELSENDEMVQYLPVKNPWSRYFLINAPKDNENFITLFVEIYPFERVLLRFPKAL